MANSPTPNPNRRRRLTADELIAIVVAMAGIGTVFFWGLGQKNSPLNLLQGGTALNRDTGNRQGGLLGSNAASSGQERQTIASISERERSDNPAPPTITSPVAPSVSQIEAPVETTTTVSPQATVPAPSTVVVPVVPVLPPTTAPTLPIVKAPEFTDVPQKFWGATYITELGKRGILDDFGEGKFDPTKPITRGEYAKMLDRAFADKPASATTSSFNDIPADYPRKEAVDGSVKRGFMTGYSPTKFAPNQPIPRYQLQISLAKGMQLPTSASEDRVLSKFTDVAQMPKYARGKMASAIEAGLVVKDQATNKLQPVQNATRADAAALVYEALVKEGKIKPQP